MITKKRAKILDRRFFLYSFLLIAVAGLMLRVEVSRELLSSDVQVSRPSAMTDMATYRELSEQILEGGFKDPYYYQPFYYSAFLPFVKMLFGRSPWALIFSQSIISTLTICLGMLVSARLWGRFAGIVTGILLAGSAVLSLYVPYYLIATLQAFWTIFILHLSVKALRGGSMLRWGIVGLAVSLAILTRGNIWFFVPVIAYFAFIFPGGKGREAAVSAKFASLGLFLAAVVLPQFPWAIKNSMVLGKLSGPSTASDAVLALGNTPEAPPGGRTPGFGPGPMEYPETYHWWIQQRDKVSVKKRILRWALESPAAFLELQFRKLLLFWDSREIPNNIAFEYQGIKSVTLRHMFPGSVLLVSALAGIIMFIARRFPAKLALIPDTLKARPEKWLLLGLVAAYWPASAAFYILGRFRVPALPLLAIFAGAAFAQLGTGIRAGWSVRELMRRCLLPAALSLFIVVFSYDIYRMCIEPGLMRYIRPSGTVTEVGPGRILVKDHGPITFGGWRAAGLREGDRIVKHFAVPEQTAGPATFAIPLIWAGPGAAILQVDGKSVEIESKNAGRFVHEFELGKDFDGKVTLLFSRINADISCILDGQRNYGRTMVNGDSPRMELVCSLYLEKQPMPETNLNPM